LKGQTLNAPKTGSLFDFNGQISKNLSKSLALYRVWWWPGNDVTDDELKREIKLLAIIDLPASKFNR
jgi:hypothetical protein